MKKVTATVLAILLVFMCASLGACGTKGPEATVSLTPTPEPTPTPLAAGEEYRVAVSDVNLRSAPDTADDSNIIDEKYYNAKVAVLGTTGEFSIIRLNDYDVGYMATEYLRPADELKMDSLPYYIYVEKESFTMTIYEKGEDEGYSVIKCQYKIAHGGNKSPAGTYTILDRVNWHPFANGGSVQYAMRYDGKLYLHGPYYAQSDPLTMWPKYYNGEKGIGTPSTGGCFRMCTEASKFIYENCPDGTVVEVVNGSPRETTSENPPPYVIRNVDPTDTAAMELARQKGLIKD